MGAAHVPLTQPETPGAPIKVVNSPQAIVRAYLARKRQLMALVLGAGASFVWGIQPAWFCKPVAPAEDVVFAKIREIAPQNRPLYESLPPLYDLVRTHQRVPSEGNLCDVHGWFGRFGAHDALFVDHCHLNPAGDAMVAQAYFETITEKVLPDLQTKRLRS